MDRQNLGRAGEAIALACYQAMGFDCLARRYRKSCGELDIVMRQAGLLAFVEVKTRRGAACGRAAEAVTSVKLARMRRTAREYLHAHPVSRGLVYRFDVAAIDFSRDMLNCRIELLQGIIC